MVPFYAAARAGPLLLAATSSNPVPSCFAKARSPGSMISSPSMAWCRSWMAAPTPSSAKGHGAPTSAGKRPRFRPRLPSLVAGALKGISEEDPFDDCTRWPIFSQDLMQPPLMCQSPDHAVPVAQAVLLHAPQRLVQGG